MYTEPKYVDPVDTCFSCIGTSHIVCHECKVLHCTLHGSILCQPEMCAGLRQFWAANLATAAVASAVVTAVAVSAVNTPLGVSVAVVASAVNTRPGVWICRKWYAVLAQYPRNANGQLRNDQESCTKVQGELKKAVFRMCTKREYRARCKYLRC